MSILLSIDPSLSCTGWATFDITEHKLLNCGVVQESEGADLVARCDDVVRRTLASAFSVHDMSEITDVVLELPQTQVHGMERYAQATLPNYGMIVGYFAAWIKGGILFRPRLHPVTVTQWALRSPTGGKQKPRRVAAVQYRFGLDLLNGPDKLPKDIAGNAADAILLGDWFLNQAEAAVRAHLAVHGGKKA